MADSTSQQTSVNQTNQSEFLRRHRATQIVVFGILASVGVLLIASLVATRFFTPTAFDPTLMLALRVGIAVFAVGVIIFRRVRMQPARLRDIHGVEGMSNLLASLQTTTIILAVICEAIAVMGFVATILTGDTFNALFACGVAIVLLVFYVFPRRAVWQRIVEYAQQT